MAVAKVAVTIDPDLLNQIDELVALRRFPSRSKAIQEAIKEKLARERRELLAQECAKLDPREEQAMAEEGMEWELASWPEY